MATANKFTPEQRDEIIRKWVRATPAERKALSKEYGFDHSLPGYWRRAGRWPKDLTTPAPASAEHALPQAPPLKPPLTVVPRDSQKEPYTAEERIAIKAEHVRAQAAGADAVRAFFEKWGKPSWLYRPASEIAATRAMPSEAFKRDLVQRVEALKASEPNRPIMDIVNQVHKGMGRTAHWTSYYVWRNLYGKDATSKAAARPAAVKVPAQTDRARDDKLALVASVDKLREAGLSEAKACRQLGLARNNYRRWRNGIGLRSHGGRPRKNELMALSNRALARANGGPRVSSPVTSLIKEFVQRLAAMGAEIQEIKNTGDGHCTAVVKITETIEL